MARLTSHIMDTLYGSHYLWINCVVVKFMISLRLQDRKPVHGVR